MILKLLLINPMFFPQCKWCVNDVWLLSFYRNFLFSPWPLFHLDFWFMLVVWSVLVRWNYWTVSTTLVSSTNANTLQYTKGPNVFCPLSSQTVWVEHHRPAISCECSVPLKWLSIIVFGVAGVKSVYRRCGELFSNTSESCVWLSRNNCSWTGRSFVTVVRKFSSQDGILHVSGCVHAHTCAGSFFQRVMCSNGAWLQSFCLLLLLCRCDWLQVARCYVSCLLCCLHLSHVLVSDRLSYVIQCKTVV